MQKKAKLTKQQAEAIETMLEDETCDRIVSVRVRDGSKFIRPCESINDMDLNTLIIALYIGYEVEQTEQEKINGLFCKIKSLEDYPYATAQTYYTQAVVDTLEALGRKDLIPNLEEE
jgi:hypothetical protein